MSQALSNRRRQAGITLVEALVAMLIMAFGMVALSGLQTSLRRSSDEARQRTDAVRLAQQTLERLRGYSQLAAATPAQAASGVFGYADISSSTSATAVTVNATAFSVTQSVAAVSSPPHLDVTVNVGWTDRTGTAQTVSLLGKIAPVDPALAGAARFAPAFPVSRSPFERHEAIPTSARDLGGGYSAAQPPGTSGLFWLFDNLTGRLTGICNVASRTLGTLTSSDVSSCQTGITGGAYVISGYIRYATGTAAPSADSPAPSPIGTATAIPLRIAANLTVSGALAPDCYNDSGIAAGAGQTYASYMCAIYPSTSTTPPSWSGRIDVADITIGAGGYKVYRYTANYNGTMQSEAYTNVQASLLQQNLLVVDFSAAAPTSTPASPTTGRFVDTSVVLHQP